MSLLDLDAPDRVGPADADRFRSLWRGFGSTVALVATAHEGRRHAMLATAVTSVSMAPPSLMVCVNRDASAYPALAARGAFSLSLLPASAQPLAARIATAASADRFATGDWRWHLPGGRAEAAEDDGALPWLAGAQATLFCRVEARLDHGTHTLFVAHVREAAGAGGGDPLLYCEGRYGRFTDAM